MAIHRKIHSIRGVKSGEVSKVICSIQFSSIRSFEVSNFSVRFSWKIAPIVRSYPIQYSLRANNVDYLFVKRAGQFVKQNVCFPFNFIEILPIFHRNVYNVYFIQNLQSTCDIETVSRIDNVYIKIQHKIHILFGIGWSLCCAVLFILFCFLFRIVWSRRIDVIFKFFLHD